MKLSELISAMDNKVQVCTALVEAESKKEWTLVTIGVPWDIVTDITLWNKIVWLLVMDKEKVDEAKNNFLNSPAGQA